MTEGKKQPRGRGRPREKSDQAFRDRLRLAIGPRSVNAASAAAGISEGLLRGYLTGVTPGGDKMLQLCAALGVRLAWLVNGEGPMRSISPYAQILEGVELVRVPLYSVELSAGDGRTAWPPGEPVDFFDVSVAQVRQGRMPVSALAAFVVRGTSMEPAVRDGAIAILDTSRTVLPPDGHGIYAVRLDDELRLKYLAWEGRDLVLASEQAAAYPAIRLSAVDAERLQVIGRLWLTFDRSPSLVQD